MEKFIVTYFSMEKYTKRKALFTWIGVVSGLITIMLVFKNPFANSASLNAYIELQGTLTSKENNTFDTKPYENIDVLTITIENNGELPANKIHINNKMGSTYKTIVKINDSFIEYPTKQAIYIDRLEANDIAEVFFWGTFYDNPFINFNNYLTISSSDTGKAKLRSDIHGDGIIWYIHKYKIYIFSIIISAIIFLFNTPFFQKKETKNDSKDLEQKLKNLNYAWSIGVISDQEFSERGKKLLDD